MIVIPRYPPRPPLRSDRTRQIAHWFELPLATSGTETASSERIQSNDLTALLPDPQTITLILGPSGSGKSSLLRTLQNTHSDRAWLDINNINLPELPTVDCLGAMPLTDALRALCAVGLAEVWTWLRTPGELSDGQRWRLKLAMALRAVETEARTGAKETILCCDEFAAGLDRITATVVARELHRRIASKPIASTCSAIACRCSAIIATCNPDLLPALEPAVVAHCDFGLIHIERRGSAHEQE